ncbi:MAG: FKBP-type peptidyl-prolyl cis-trans isomerase [Desulfobacula sp.]|jgi:FKBP-type peptidyl-prolyl cis-trans isomerase|nr:FKBP-type peptidyl-prolyl cis-trans isomerase [Desulfobacula sp.]
MKHYVMLKITLVLAIIFILNSSVYADSEITKETLKTAGMDDKVSYAIGFNICNQLKDSIKINTELFSQGMKDNLTKQPKMTEETIKETLMAFQNMVRQKQMGENKKKATENKAKGKAFLEENKTKDGVKELPSGLQYKVIKAGDGLSPKLDDKVKCHYRGTLIDGSVFDSSYKRNQPAVFPVNGVIKGWIEALQLMKVGSKWMLYVPSDLGYGDTGAGKDIKPGDALIFEVELLAIEQ